MPPGDQRLSRQRPPADGPELGYRLTRPRDGDLLTLSYPVHDLAALGPQLADRDLGHTRHCITRETRRSGTWRLSKRRRVTGPGVLAREMFGSCGWPSTKMSGPGSTIRHCAEDLG